MYGELMETERQRNLGCALDSLMKVTTHYVAMVGIIKQEIENSQ